MKMKRILLGASLSVLGLATLASCGNETNTVTYTDAEGNVQKLDVNTTNDSEKAVDALCAVVQSYDSEKIDENYKTINGIKLSASANIDAGLKSTINSHFPYEENVSTQNTNGSIKAKASANAIIDFANSAASAGIDVNGTVKYTNKVTNTIDTTDDKNDNINVTANADINLYYDTTGAYVDGNVSVDGLDDVIASAGFAASGSSVDTSELTNFKYMLPAGILKTLITSMLIDENTENIPTSSQIASYLDLSTYTSMLTEAPATIYASMIENVPEAEEDLKELYAEAKEYNLAISATSSDSITFKASTTLAAVYGEDEEDEEEDSENIFAECTAPINFEVTFSTKYFIPTGVKLDASAALKEISGKELSFSNEYQTVSRTFTGSKLVVEAKLAIGDLKAKTLTDSVKKEYTDMSAFATLLKNFGPSIFNF